MGKLCQAARLFTKVLEVQPRHERALDQRAECHQSLGDLESAISDLRELSSTFGDAAEHGSPQQWQRRIADAKQQQQFDAYETLGVDRRASSAEIRKAYLKLSLQVQAHAAALEPWTLASTPAHAHRSLTVRSSSHRPWTLAMPATPRSR